MPYHLLYKVLHSIIGSALSCFYHFAIAIWTFSWLRCMFWNSHLIPLYLTIFFSLSVRCTLKPTILTHSLIYLYICFRIPLTSSIKYLFAATSFLSAWEYFITLEALIKCKLLLLFVQTLVFGRFHEDSEINWDSGLAENEVLEWPARLKGAKLPVPDGMHPWLLGKVQEEVSVGCPYI